MSARRRADDRFRWVHLKEETVWGGEPVPLSGEIESEENGRSKRRPPLGPMKLHYEEPTRLERDEVHRILRDGSTEEIVRALVSMALLEEDFDFALSVIVGCSRSDEPAIRGMSILALGHLARIHRRLPVDPVVDLVQAALADQDASVRGRAGDAADDIEMFVPSVGRRLRR